MATKRTTLTKRKLGRPPKLEDAVPVLVYLERWQRDALKARPGSLNENVRQAVTALLEQQVIEPDLDGSSSNPPGKKPTAQPRRPVKGRGVRSA
jgi:hypothetical protein